MNATKNSTIRLWSKAQIIAHVERAGSHFFERGTMRFFSSRFYDGHVVTGKNGTFFVTSERFNDLSPRLYTVRQVTHDGVDTIGEFQAYKAAKAAMNAARSLAS